MCVYKAGQKELAAAVDCARGGFLRGGCADKGNFPAGYADITAFEHGTIIAQGEYSGVLKQYIHSGNPFNSTEYSAYSIFYHTAFESV